VGTTRIVLVGAGSSVFGPGLFESAAKIEELRGATLVLLGHTPERAETTRALAARMIAELGAQLSLESTLEPARALDGADFVVCSIGVGGLAARRIDVELPQEYGVVQTKGDSTGPGGLSRTLRTVPPMLELARQMERSCPEALLLNYSNPMTPICTALALASKVSVVGMCDGVAMARSFLAGYLGLPPAELRARCAGVNHCAWITELSAGGEDVYPRLWQRLEEIGVQAEPVSFELLRLYGLYPSPADVHVAKFFPHFLNAAAENGRAWGLSPWPAEQLICRRAADEETLRQRALGLLPPEPVKAEVGEAALAMEIIAAFIGEREMEFTANLPNAGEAANLPRGAVVETPAVAGGRAIRALSVGDLPAGIAALSEARLAQQRLIAEAALSGDRAVALQALVIDPLMSAVPVARAREMLSRLLAMHERYLPQFRTRGS